jgi:hypothetical protein
VIADDAIVSLSVQTIVDQPVKVRFIAVPYRRSVQTAAHKTPISAVQRRVGEPFQADWRTEKPDPRNATRASVRVTLHTVEASKNGRVATQVPRT